MSGCTIITPYCFINNNKNYYLDVFDQIAGVSVQDSMLNWI